MTDTPTHTDRLPVTLLAGFLGSGKTTLANRILSEQHNQRIAVIVNEFGDVGIDGSLVVGVKDNIVELNNGCICCTVRNDLVETLNDLMLRREQFAHAEPFERVLIEASGMASPGPAVQTLLMDRKLSTQFRLDGVITMAHAQHIVEQLQEHPEASEQVGYADQIILNHCDQSTPEALEAAENVLRSCNREASIMQSTRADVDVSSLLRTRTWEPEAWQLARAEQACEPDCDDEDHDHHGHGTVHTSGVGTLTLRLHVPLDLNRLKMWLLFVAKRQSHELMRLKGILNCKGHDRAVIVQGVYQWLELQSGAVKAPEVSILVLIGRNLDAEELSREWTDCQARDVTPSASAI
jgi:G3E family GTPase